MNKETSKGIKEIIGEYSLPSVRDLLSWKYSRKFWKRRFERVLKRHYSIKKAIKEDKKINKQFYNGCEYEIEKEDKLYVAGIRKVKLKGCTIVGDLYLDELIRETGRYYSCFLSMPLWTGFAPRDRVKKEDISYIKKTEKREHIFCLKQLQIANIVWKKEPANSIDRFVENVQTARLSKYDYPLDEEYIKHFFEKLHTTCMDYFIDDGIGSRILA